MDKKKIMHIAQSPGGVERYINMFLKNINSNEFENILICSQDYKEENYKGLVSAFESIDMIREINFRKDLKSIIEVRKLINKYKPDIVYMHSSKAGAIGRIANLGIKNKSIYNPHGWAFNMQCSSRKKKVYIYIEKILAKFVDIIIAISNYEKRSALQEKICSEKKIKVILNGIDINEYVNREEDKYVSREIIGIPKDAYVIGTVGRLSDQKAPDTFVKTAALIRKEIPNSFFVFVGDGEKRDEIEKLILELGLNDCFYISGWVKEPMDYIKIFDQAMLLSRWEGFGLVLAEYMFSNKPIIATRVDAIPELINHKENGILVEVDNLEQIRCAVVEIFNDKNLRNNMVNVAKKVLVSKFDIGRVINEHISIFKNDES